jgi:hypothetical protein
MGKLSKNEIKSALSQKNTLQKIEPILASHRKALIELNLQKKFTTEESDPKLLIKYFNQSIQNQDVNEALYIQNIIFEKLKDNQLPSDFIGKLEVPNELFYESLLNNFAVYNYEKDQTQLYENILNFERLLKLLPGNIKIMYNLTALKLIACTDGKLATYREDIRDVIYELELKGLEKSLITRLNVNYNIVLTEYYNLKNDFKNKNKSLSKVSNYYSHLKLSDQDLLSLSKYMAIYSKFDWAESILAKRIIEVDASEDIIFYYLALTLSDPKKIESEDYRTIVLNAIDKNNKRFCDIFLPTSQDGYTFQLLSNEFLKNNYCENCSYETQIPQFNPL